MTDASPVRGDPPPQAVLRVINPILRTLIASPAGRLVPQGLAVLRFEGRRTARTYEIVVSWHGLDAGHVVFTPARWRGNFRGGAPVTAIVGGRRLTGTGTLVDDPEQVAVALQRILDEGTQSRMVGLSIPDGHRLTAEDIRATGRAMIRIDA